LSISVRSGSGCYSRSLRGIFEYLLTEAGGGRGSDVQEVLQLAFGQGVAGLVPQTAGPDMGYGRKVGEQMASDNIDPDLTLFVLVYAHERDTVLGDVAQNYV
jgi:hypothetical protein